MNPIWQFVSLLAIHWLADFVLQTHWQASNKSKSNEALARHVGCYTIALFFAVPFIFPGDMYGKWLAFIAINGALHLVTDYFTSRASSRLYAKQDWHNFFVVIGFDQLIHQVTLALTMVAIFGGAV